MPRAIRFHETGKPSEVLKLEELPSPPVGPADVRIQLEAATVNPSDMGLIGGSYGRGLDLPAVAGREGVGRIVEAGSEADAGLIGRRVQMPEPFGVWREEVVAPANDLLFVPNDLPAEQAALAFINPPTALRLLKDYIELQEGDWIIQNAANSAVGFSVVAYAKRQGYRTINLVRDLEKWEKPLKAAGADVVLSESDTDYPKKIKELTGGGKPRLGLNSIGGESVSNIIKSMGENAEVVTFGGMVSDPVRFPTRFLIFSGLRLTGFWMDKWRKTNPPEAFQELMDEVFALIADRSIEVPIDQKFAFDDALEAVERGFSGSRNGKVILTGPAAQ